MLIQFELGDDATARLRFIMAEHNACNPLGIMDEHGLAQSLILALLDDDMFAHPAAKLDA